MAIDKTVVNKRLAVLVTEADFLKKLKLSDYNRFVRDPKTLRAAVRAFELIAQSIIDIAGHIVAQKRLGVPDSYRDTISLLAREGLLEQQLSERLQRLVSVRNLLVHQYLELDYRVIFDNVPSVIEDSSAFVAAVRHLIGSS